MTRFLLERRRYAKGYFLWVNYGGDWIPVVTLPEDYWCMDDGRWLESLAFAIMSRLVADAALANWWGFKLARDFLLNCPPTGWELAADDIAAWMSRVVKRELEGKASPWSK